MSVRPHSRGQSQAVESAGGRPPEAIRDPRSPDAQRARRGPDFRLLLPAMAAWAATAAAILLRGPWVAVAAAGLALGLATVLGTSRVRSYLRWRRVLRAAGWNLVAAAVIASLAAAGTALQVNRVDSHPMMRELSASESGGQQGESNKGETRAHYRGEVTVAGGARVLNGGSLKVPVRITGLGELPLFISDRHRSPELLSTQPGSTLELAATVRADERPGLVPARLSATRQPTVTAEPRGLMGLSARLRRNINELASTGPMATLANQAWFSSAEALIPGMLIGDISQMPQDIRQHYIVSGLSHLTAVSGLHVVVLISAVTIAATACGVSRRGKWVIVMGTLVAFTMVVGPLPSILRAGFMGIVGAVAVLSSRWSDSLAALGGAVLALVLIQPGMAVEYGLLLSVLATVAIVTAGPRIGRWLILGWGRFTQRRWARGPRVVEGMLLRALAVSFVADVATQPTIVMMTGIVSPAAVPANLAVGWAVAPLMVLALAACLVGSVALLVGMPAGLAAWLLVPAAPAAWWIHTVAEQCSRTWVLHTPGGPWWALAWAAMLGTMILASMGVLWWQVIPVLIACAMLLVRIGAWQLGPYETAAQAPSWGSDLGAESHWTVAVCGGGHGASDWQLRYPTGKRQPCQTPRGKLTLQAGGVTQKNGEPGVEKAPQVVTVSSEALALSVRRAALIVVVDCGSSAETTGTRRSHGRPSRTPGGVPVHYPCADGAGLLTPKGLVVSGGPR